MGQPLCALLNPAPDLLNFLCAQLAHGVSRGHLVVRIVTRDSVKEFRLLWMTSRDNVLGNGSFNIKPKFRFPSCFVRTVATEAAIGQDRQDVAVETDLVLGEYGFWCHGSDAAGKDQQIPDTTSKSHRGYPE